MKKQVRSNVGAAAETFLLGVINEAGQWIYESPTDSKGRLKAVAAIKVPTDTDDVIGEEYGKKVYLPPINKAELLNGAYSNPYLLKALRTKVNYKGGVNFAIDFDEESGGTEKKAKELTDILWNMEGPNKMPGQFHAKLREALFDYDAGGDGYLVFGTNAKGVPTWVDYRKAAFVRVLATKEGGFVEITNKGKNVIYYKNFAAPPEIRKLQMHSSKDGGAWEMLQIRKPNPISSRYGVPDHIASWASVVGMSMCEDFRHAVFNNYAMPAYAVVITGNTKKAPVLRDEIKQQWQKIKGASNAAKTVALTLPPNTTVDFKPLNSDFKEGFFLNLDENYISKILTGADVPPAKGGVIKTGALAGESTQEQYQDFLTSVQFDGQPARDAVFHVLRRFDEKIMPAQYWFEPQMEGLYITSSMGQVISTLWATNAITGNEIRKLCGQKPRIDPSGLGDMTKAEIDLQLAALGGLQNQQPMGDDQTQP